MPEPQPAPGWILLGELAAAVRRLGERVGDVITGQAAMNVKLDNIKGVLDGLATDLRPGIADEQAQRVRDTDAPAEVKAKEAEVAELKAENAELRKKTLTRRVGDIAAEAWAGTPERVRTGMLVTLFSLLSAVAGALAVRISGQSPQAITVTMPAPAATPTEMAAPVTP